MNGGWSGKAAGPRMHTIPEYISIGQGSRTLNCDPLSVTLHINRVCPVRLANQSGRGKKETPDVAVGPGSIVDGPRLPGGSFHPNLYSLYLPK